MKRIYFYLVFMTLAFLAACTKAPDYPTEPVITYKGINKKVITQGSSSAPVDTLKFMFTFTDGDGDLKDGKILYMIAVTAVSIYPATSRLYRRRVMQMAFPVKSSSMCLPEVKTRRYAVSQTMVIFNDFATWIRVFRRILFLTLFKYKTGQVILAIRFIPISLRFCVSKPVYVFAQMRESISFCAIGLRLKIVGPLCQGR